MSGPIRLRRRVLCLTALAVGPLALGHAAFAAQPTPTVDKSQLEAGPVEDPIEPVNRRLFRVDQWINNVLAGRGRIIFTARWIPAPIREGLYNAFDNLDEPDTAANWSRSRAKDGSCSSTIDRTRSRMARRPGSAVSR